MSSHSTSRSRFGLRTPFVAAGVLLAGSGAAAFGAGTAQTHTATTTARAAAAAPCTSQALRALSTAHRRTSGRAYDIDGDRYRNQRVWEIEVDKRASRPYELIVSADGKKVIRNRRASKPDHDAVRARSAKVSLATAIRTAARRASGCLSEAEIDRERGKLVWSVTFKQGRLETEVDVDARSGSVVKVERDLDD